MAPPPQSPRVGEELQDWEEGTGESSPPPRSPRALKPDVHEVLRRICERLSRTGRHVQALASPSFHGRLARHLQRLPRRYLVDLDVDDKAEDVLLHWEILDECADPDKRPVFRARYVQCLTVRGDYDGSNQDLDEPCQRLMEDLSLERRKAVDGNDSMSISSRGDLKNLLIHEIIFSSLDRPKLLSRLTALLSEIDLNIREAHVYSTTDGFCLDVFVVDGWETEETDELIAKIKETLTHKNASPSNSTNSSTSEKILDLQQKVGDSEIDSTMLTKGEKIASGSSADLYRGTYNGRDVAIKILRIANLNNPSEIEFLQEVLILRSVNHENILQFYGACTRHPNYCIVTEYMPGGNLYDFLHKQNNLLELLTVLRIAIGISKGMDYLHQNNIIHRDLKTANLLIGYDQVVKIADFGVARLGSQEGQMTAETGTYRWMAPEIINHKPYDHKADVFSFAIVLWELATSKVPYDNMTPLQAALGVRQGLRLDIPASVHPRLTKLIQGCWDEDPDVRPSFAEIIVELEGMLQHVQAPKGASRRSRAKMQKKSER
ncbi:serine/threonine-protein kinase STY8-like [Phragmites australis]|uniref:serine/threonine-protein kinase STY8-like n=1 Tax=Phragmites australis TaxID=29695 RepID=UPI002D7A14A0|nr:serine/threonine-protein kinase STY8-like [Phragmites australis]